MPVSRKSRRAPDKDSQLVGIAEVGSRLGISAERVRQLAKSGEMPASAGQLGRQLIWRWNDVEAWARQAGRLGNGRSGHALDSKRSTGFGTLRLVVDEVLNWGRSSQKACHVRVWAPPSGSAEPHVVLLGHLNELRGASLTNEIEIAAMTVSLRYLGDAWRQARFYEYSPAG